MKENNIKKGTSMQMSFQERLKAMLDYWHDILKRDPLSYSYPFHQDAALKRDFPQEYAAWKKETKSNQGRK